MRKYNISGYNINKTIASLLVITAIGAGSLASLAYADEFINIPAPQAGQYIHTAPTLEQLPKDKNLAEVILKGRDLFTDTHSLMRKYTFSNLNCDSCHLSAGSLAFAGPVWPAATTLPAYRGKNKHVNDIQERIAGCFAFSMNGIPPAYGSDEMVALVSYISWQATGAKMYDTNIYGRGYGSLPKLTGNYESGHKIYQERCQVCHGDNGQGQSADGEVVFPPLWGSKSFNWGAGMVRTNTAAAFIKNNMPLGLRGSLTDQEAWDVAMYVTSQERPQDPRFEVSAEKTREKYLNFHKLTQYGLMLNGKILGDNPSPSDKPIFKPDSIKDRKFDFSNIPDE